MTSYTYDRSSILALRLRAAANLRRLSRNELFSRLQILRTVEPVVGAAYKDVLRRRWLSGDDDSPHGEPWHVSFHASQFPGDDPMACPRQALYRLMNMPGDGPPSRFLHLTATTGKAIEIELVNILQEAGELISAPIDAEYQTRFVIPEVMLTGTIDSAIEMRRRPTPVEIKTKFQDVIDKMRLGMVGPDLGHVKQLKTQLGLIRAAQQSDQLWGDMELCDRGYIYYLSRDRPSDTAEFLVEYDPTFFETGVEVLKQWRVLWDEEVLPSVNPSKRHPMGWRWSYPPCNYCSYKKTCQADHKAGVTELEESTGIETAREAREGYSYQKAREEVKTRWESSTTAG